MSDMSAGKYDDLFPLCLHQAKDGQWHILDRHNDEVAIFTLHLELGDMRRIVDLANAAALASGSEEPPARREGKP
jgi:hypothetical protein